MCIVMYVRYQSIREHILQNREQFLSNKVPVPINLKVVFVGDTTVVRGKQHIYQNRTNYADEKAQHVFHMLRLFICVIYAILINHTIKNYL